MKYINKSKVFYFFLTVTVLTFFSILNYTIKTPNDGTIYVSAADYFLKNGLLVNPIESFNNLIRPFPTTQVGIIFFLAILKFFFGDFWNIFYVLFISILWTYTLNYLLIFLKDIFKNANLVIIFLFPLILFLNYDNLNSSTSFYNEAIYYPLFVIIFTKILKYLYKNQDFKIFENYTFLIIFCLLCLFRLQNIIFMGSICLFFLFQKQYGKFFKLGVLSIFTLVIVFYFAKYLPSLNSVIKDESSLNFLKYHTNFTFNTDFSLFDQFKLDFIKNIKVQLVYYSHFTNISKIVNINIPNNFLTAKEFSYLILSISILLIFIHQFRNSKYKNIYKFFLIYTILSHLFTFFVFDHDTRYYIYHNLLIIFVLYDFILNNLKIKKIRFLAPLYVFPLIFIFIYGIGYFININKTKNVYIQQKLIRNLEKNRNYFFSDNEIFISKFPYTIYWVTRKTTYRPFQFFENEIKNKLTDVNILYIGNLNDVKKLQDENQISSFTEISLKKEDEMGIWKLIF